MKNTDTQEPGAALADALSGPLQLGKRYYVHTISYHHVGTLKSLREQCGIWWATLVDVCFVSDSGPFEKFFMGVVEKWEKSPDITVNVNHLTEFYDGTKLRGK